MSELKLLSRPELKLRAEQPKPAKSELLARPSGWSALRLLSLTIDRQARWRLKVCHTLLPIFEFKTSRQPHHFLC
jgi:hypothetical protein